jgi:hypothetical protein
MLNIEYGDFKLKNIKAIISFRLEKSIENRCKSLIPRNLLVEE